MSQRGCAGFNWPPSHIPAREPVSRSPVTVRRIGPMISETKKPVFRLLSVFPASLYPFCAGVPAIGVGHPDSHTCRPNSALIGTLLHCAPSL